MRPSSFVTSCGLGISFVALSLFACGGDDAPAADSTSSSGASGNSNSTTGTSSSSSSSTGGETSSSSGSSSGLTSSSSSTGGVPVGPGNPPTRTCTEAEPLANRGDFKVTTAKDGYVYWVHLPKSYDRKNPAPTPSVIGLHGCSDAAKNFITWGISPWDTLDTQDHIGIAVENSKEPGCWGNADDVRVAAVLEDVAQCYYLDQRKIVLAGYSSGGSSAYRVALTQSDRFAGFLAYKTSLSSTGQADKLIQGAKRKLPIVHVAGTGDENFAIAGVRADAAKLKAAGFPMELIEKNAGHSGESTDWQTDLLPKRAGWSL